ncbi:MAG: NAD(P)H-hydrate dehydratase [Actinomycetia bacterium]|nr:NAD(P)H-hydrate dehydratase [Actinomycetes bacterium]
MPHPVEVTPEVLSGLPLPQHDDGDSKHDRGSVFVLGGSVETPGAILLAGLAALRAGAGRLGIATASEVAPAVAVAVPEARVLADDDWQGPATSAAAVLYGCGVLDVDGVDPVLDELTSSVTDGLVVLDAGAFPAVSRHPDWVHRLEGRVLLVPNATELEVLGCASAVQAADRFRAVVAVRDADTVIAAPDGRCYVDRHGTVGLATSGSGDVAAGIAVGLLGRGADPLTAAVWTAAVHGRAGERLGGPGFLARELLPEIPKALADLGA